MLSLSPGSWLLLLLFRPCMMMVFTIIIMQQPPLTVLYQVFYTAVESCHLHFNRLISHTNMLYFLFSVVAVLCTTGNSQVSTKVRPQPPSTIVSALEIVRDCCQHINDVENLLTCSNMSKSMSNSHSGKVSLVTYLDSDKGQFNIPDIFKFGAYMVANTAAYAELNDYSFRWLARDTGSNYQPGDARWNKVKIIDEALDPVTGWAKDR